MAAYTCWTAFIVVSDVPVSVSVAEPSPQSTVTVPFGAMPRNGDLVFSVMVTWMRVLPSLVTYSWPMTHDPTAANCSEISARVWFHPWAVRPECVGLAGSDAGTSL